MRTLVIMAFALASAMWTDAAWSVPPDQIHNSPIPPLKAPERQTTRRQPVQQQTPQAPESDILLAPTTATPAPSANGRASYPAAAPQNGENRYEGEQPADYGQQRTQLWNSPQMREARQWVMEYVRRSNESSEREGIQFLQGLSQLSPEAMRDWLERYQQSRMRLAVDRDSADYARQLLLENAAVRQEQTQQAFDNINRYQSAAAAWAQDRFLTLNSTSQQLRIQRATSRDMAVLNDLQQDFDPFFPSFDPASPQGRRKYWAAAASLPGDLPPSDPRNFIRGDEGIDTGAGTSPQDTAAAGGSGESGGSAAAAAAPAGDGEGE